MNATTRTRHTWRAWPRRQIVRAEAQELERIEKRIKRLQTATIADTDDPAAELAEAKLGKARRRMTAEAVAPVCLTR